MYLSGWLSNSSDHMTKPFVFKLFYIFKYLFYVSLFRNGFFSIRDQSLFITWGGGGGGSEDFGGDHLIFRRTDGGISRN